MAHEHSHAHGAAAGRRPLAIALGIGVLLFLVQVVGAALTNSLTLLFDAAHVLADAVGLGLALAAAVLGDRPAAGRRTWGWKRSEVLAAALQSSLLLAVGAFVLVQALLRFVSPEPVASREMVVFGLLGLVGNGLALAVLSRGQQNLNLRAAVLEVATDALGSLAVVLTALVIGWTGWLPADPLLAVLIGLLILPRAFGILRESLSVLLETAPPGADLEGIRQHIQEQDHVVDVHDLHVSRISTDLPVLTAHVILEDECFQDGHSAEILCRIQNCVAEHFEVSIAHSTIQLEPAAHYQHEREDIPL